METAARGTNGRCAGDASHQAAQTGVEKSAAASANPVQDAVERAPALLIFVEAEMHEIAHDTARLRDTERIHLVEIAAEHTGHADARLRGGREISRRREGNARDKRILRVVHEFIEPALFEPRPLR